MTLKYNQLMLFANLFIFAKFELGIPHPHFLILCNVIGTLTFNRELDMWEGTGPNFTFTENI